MGSVCLALGTMVACAWFAPRAADFRELAVCVLEHDRQGIETIAVVCAIEDREAIADILRVHHATRDAGTSETAP
jgi:hypothetical protein